MNETGGTCCDYGYRPQKNTGDLHLGLGWVTLWCGPAGQFVLSMNWVSSNFVGVKRNRGGGEARHGEALDTEMAARCHCWTRWPGLTRSSWVATGEWKWSIFNVSGQKWEQRVMDLDTVSSWPRPGLPGSALPKWSWVNVSVRFMIQLSEAKEKRSCFRTKML